MEPGLYCHGSPVRLVNGYPDGSFRPKNQITRGEAAILVVKAVGTPVQTRESTAWGAPGAM